MIAMFHKYLFWFCYVLLQAFNFWSNVTKFNFRNIFINKPNEVQSMGFVLLSMNWIVFFTFITTLELKTTNLN